MTLIGVLALQGDFAEHCAALKKAGAIAVEVRLPAELVGLDGLIIPGGESTTLRRLIDSFGLMEPLRAFAAEKATWGTCAGAILLAREIEGQAPHLGVMDMAMRRNAFGRQIDSFVETIQIDQDAQPYAAVFIRAPLIVSVGAKVSVLARLHDGQLVAVQQGHLLATAFHPELTSDLRFHQRFIKLAQECRL